MNCLLKSVQEIQYTDTKYYVYEKSENLKWFHIDNLGFVILCYDNRKVGLPIKEVAELIVDGECLIRNGNIISGVFPKTFKEVLDEK